MEPDEQVDSSDLVWAKEVMTVYRFLGQHPTKKALGSHSAKHLHDLVSTNPEFEKTFLTSMVQKATDVIQKSRKPEESEHIMATERRAIAELQALVSEAVAESQNS